MEFGPEYDQFLQKEIAEKNKYKNNFHRLWVTNKTFKYSVIGGASLLLVILIVIIVGLFLPDAKFTPDENRIVFIDNSKEDVNAEYLTEYYIPSKSEAEQAIFSIGTIISDYFRIGLYNENPNSVSDVYRRYATSCTPSYKSSLNAMMLKTNGDIRTNINDCPTDANGECYNNLDLYLVESLAKLGNFEEVYNDLAVCQNGLINSGEYVEVLPLNNYRIFSSLNMITYYSDYRYVDANNQDEINAEIWFYKRLIEIFFENYDKIDYLYREVSLDYGTESMDDYTGNNYIKFVNIIPKVSSNRVVDIQILIDFVPKQHANNYSSLVRNSEKWTNYGIVTADLNASKLWNATMGGENFGFSPYKIDLLTSAFYDYTPIIRNSYLRLDKLPYYNPTLNLTTDMNKQYTYQFTKGELTYHNIVSPLETLSSNSTKLINEIAISVFTEYSKRAKDLFANEILNGATLDYNWEYVYNNSLNYTLIPPNLDINKFATGIAVNILVKDSSGNIINQHTVTDKEVTINHNQATLK